MSSVVDQKSYKAFLTEIKEKVYAVQYQAMKQVNKALIGLYWDIGQSIVAKQKQHNWGKSVVEKAIGRPAKGVPRNGGVQQPKYVADANVLPRI